MRTAVLPAKFAEHEGPELNTRFPTLCNMTDNLDKIGTVLLKRPMTSEELAERLNVAEAAVLTRLQTLRKIGIAEMIEGAKWRLTAEYRRKER
jgi:Mn-dependent DtxR family transcriptional regulator